MYGGFSLSVHTNFCPERTSRSAIRILPSCISINKSFTFKGGLHCEEKKPDKFLKQYCLINHHDFRETEREFYKTEIQEVNHSLQCERADYSSHLWQFCPMNVGAKNEIIQGLIPDFP